MGVISPWHHDCGMAALSRKMLNTFLIVATISGVACLIISLLMRSIPALLLAFN